MCSYAQKCMVTPFAAQNAVLKVNAPNLRFERVGLSLLIAPKGVELHRVQPKDDIQDPLTTALRLKRESPDLLD